MEKQVFVCINGGIKKKAIEAVTAIEGAEPLMVVTIDEHKETRSGAQRRLQWRWYTEMSKFLEGCKGKTFSPKAIHAFLAELYQPQESLEGPDGKWITRTKSTVDNNVKEMHQYLEKIEMYCANEWGCILTIPPDLRYAMGVDKAVKTFDGEAAK